MKAQLLSNFQPPLPRQNKYPIMLQMSCLLRLTPALQQILIRIEDIEEIVDGPIVVLFRKDVSVVAMDDGLKGSVLLCTASRQ